MTAAGMLRLWKMADSLGGGSSVQLLLLTLFQIASVAVRSDNEVRATPGKRSPFQFAA